MQLLLRIATNVDFKPAHWMEKDAIASSGFYLLHLSRSKMMHQAATAPVLIQNFIIIKVNTGAILSTMDPLQK